VADQYVFGDEAGNFDFDLKPGASRYFILCTATMHDPAVGNDLLALRREMAWNGMALDSELHATTDRQAVRDEVFNLLAGADFRVDATIFEKRKTKPHRQNEDGFYQLAWFLHFKYVAPKITQPGDRLLVTAASLGTKKKKAEFHNAVKSVVAQVTPAVTQRVAFWPANSDPCLQIADYCTWAIQRKWEGGDDRSHALIKDKIKSEFDIWQIGQHFYY
jgi:hypothetical protein